MNVVVLTGAGVSAESGLPTFRGAGGLWEGKRPEEVASPQAFAADPDLVHRFYNERRRRLLDPAIQPNAAHLALRDFEQHWRRGEFTLVTQNVDDLHQRVGTQNLIAMHGELLKVRCQDSGKIFDWREDLSTQTPHPLAPERQGRLRPHIVWFGETPLHMERIERKLFACDLFVAIGTSGLVYPAAAFVSLVPPDCHKVEINVEPSRVARNFDRVIHGRASEEVPKFFGELLKP